MGSNFGVFQTLKPPSYMLSSNSRNKLANALSTVQYVPYGCWHCDSVCLRHTSAHIGEYEIYCTVSDQNTLSHNKKNVSITS